MHQAAFSETSNLVTKIMSIPTSGIPKMSGIPVRPIDPPHLSPPHSSPPTLMFEIAGFLGGLLFLTLLVLIIFRRRLLGWFRRQRQIPQKQVIAEVDGTDSFVKELGVEGHVSSKSVSDIELSSEREVVELSGCAPPIYEMEGDFRLIHDRRVSNG